jgi:hypothetical protein
MVPLLLLVAHPATHVVAAKAAAAAAGISTLGLLYTISGILAGVALVLAGFNKFIWPNIKRWGNFLTDWEGEPARPGVAEKPGVMTRLQVVEFDLASVKAEVHPNHGKSIKDVVNDTNKSVRELHARVDAIDVQREGERYDREDIHPEDAVS